ncbi:MAG: hypothetical protein L6406_14780 [Desulfobacterales bacterium]|nr:hypothetical protein [Desulfobacterales bacterium]
MLRLIKPTISKVTKDIAGLKSLHSASQPDPNCGVRFAPFDYFMRPQATDTTGSGSNGIGLFPGTLTPEQFQEAVKEVNKYQAGLLAKYGDFKK